MDKAKQHAGQIETRLRHWGTMIDDFVARVAEAGAEVKSDGLEHVAQLKSKFQVAQSKLTELQAASAETWETLKTGAEKSCDDVEAAFKKLTTK